MIGIHFAGPNVAESKLRLAIACGVSQHSDSIKNPDRYEPLREYVKDRFRACSLDEADLVMFASPYKNGRVSAQCALEAQRAGVQCLFFRANDDSRPAHPPYGRVYRASIFASRRTPFEEGMPALVEDLLEPGEPVAVRKRGERPVVGFCGYVDTAIKRLVYSLTLRTEKARGLRLRYRSLATLEGSPAVDCDFISRSGFWASRKIDPNAPPDDADSARKEFLANLFGTDYNVCLRGMGNYSFRLYETMSAGRIPLFVNTDCVLPFEDEIDYRKYFAWVEESDLDRAGEIVAQFHADHTDDDFRQLQLDNRKLWQEWLSPEAFYQRIIDRAIDDARSGKLASS